MQLIDTDYLIIGSGAVGMAFADVIFHETSHHITLVDRHAAPGGHWNDAYPFVRLHQPSAYYGVNSRALGGNATDAAGLNEGMHERATSAELVSYYGQVMQQMLASNRVRYFPMSDYVGDYAGEADGLHPFKSLLTGGVQHVSVRKKSWTPPSCKPRCLRPIHRNMRWHPASAACPSTCWRKPGSRRRAT